MFQAQTFRHEATIRDHRNWDTLRSALVLLSLARMLYDPLGIAPGLLKSVHTIRESIFHEGNAGHSRNIPSYEKVPPVYRGPFSTSAKRMAALRYLNRLLPDTEIRFLLPALKIYQEHRSSERSALQDLLDRVIWGRQRRIISPIELQPCTPMARHDGRTSPP